MTYFTDSSYERMMIQKPENGKRDKSPPASFPRRCEGCPYPAHGFLCWGGEDDCMRTRVKKLNEKELEYEDQSGFV